MLISYILGISSERLLLDGTPPLSPKQQTQLDILIIELESGKPLSKIIGEREFWSLPFHVNQHVLDPRPDSETLVSQILQRFPDKNVALNILDLGTGSGCLIITLLHEYQNATGSAADISPHALDIARKNAARHGVNSRLKFVHSSWFDKVEGKFDLIISNPPYIPSKDIADLDIAVKDHDPLLALDGGEDGLAPYRMILSQAKHYLNPQGIIVFEIGYNQGPDLVNLSTQHGFQASVYKDLAGHDRCIACYVII